MKIPHSIITFRRLQSVRVLRWNLTNNNITLTNYQEALYHTSSTLLVKTKKFNKLTRKLGTISKHDQRHASFHYDSQLRTSRSSHTIKDGVNTHIVSYQFSNGDTIRASTIYFLSYLFMLEIDLLT